MHRDVEPADVLLVGRGDGGDRADAVRVWSWDDLGVRGAVSVRDGGVGGVDDIASWWSSNADRRC